MAKQEKQKAKIDEEEELKELKLAAELSGDDDDEEANEDLSLKIVEKALLMRAAKLDQNDNIGVVSDDNGNGDGGVVELASSSSLEAEALVAGPSGVKKKRKKKRKHEKETDIGDLPATVAKEEEKTEIIEKMEAGDANAVETMDNIVLRKLLRGPRYFDPPDSGWSTCYNCGEEGHMAVNCPSLAKKKKPCFVCGSLDHGAKQCPKGQDCFICKNSGHRAKDCPEKYKNDFQSSKICLKCGDSGHDMFACRNDYSFDDLKEIQCYICKSFGHLCCVNVVDDSPIGVSCYRCGDLGHTGLACSRLREEATLTATPSSCYKCGEGGHFARECRTSARAGKRNREFSTSTLRVHKVNEDNLGIKSAPRDLGKAHKKRKTKSEERGLTTPRKSKRKGGWIMEDHGESSRSMPQRSKHKSRWIMEDLGKPSQSMPQRSKHKGAWIMEDLGEPSRSMPQKSKHRGGWLMEDPRDSYMSMPQKSKHRGGWITEDPRDWPQSNAKNEHWRPPSTRYMGHKISSMTSGDHMSSSPLSKKTHRNHSGNAILQGSATAFDHRFSASRFGNSGGMLGSCNGGGIRRNDGWW